MPQTLNKSIKATEAKAVKASQSQSSYMQTRILLALWTLGEATKSELKASLVRKREKETAGEYESRSNSYLAAIAQLEADQAVLVNGNKLSLSETGLNLLEQGLLSPNFTFDAQIGAKTANALLGWMRQRASGIASSTDSKPTARAIASYEEFETVATEVFERLNQDFNLNNLVPIYRIRREIGDRLSRSQFNEWLLEMQARDVWQLIGGEMPELTPDKAEDSIKTALGDVRYYAKQL
ncbi:hypothetical protein [Leptolyngbya sp. NK1-12]|nr:hypothetical protein [Leptolyngbya sp. NK1-12]